jgi:NAD(P)-dependent dehydrogenase (short-subunit alcohol dehydrogenase family)
MKNRKLLILGSSSSIARYIVPNLDFDPDSIHNINRINDSRKDSVIANPQSLNLNFENSKESVRQISSLVESFRGIPVIAINFLGSFGEVSNLSELDIENSLTTCRQNLLPYFILAKAGMSFPKGSAIIGFSGAGVGGQNLDDSSFGYLASKAAMVVMSEVIDRQLMQNGVRFGLVAPGAFPSPMQEKVAKASSKSISLDRIRKAKEINSSSATPEKLVNTLNFLIQNHTELGGRVWSANFDPLVANNSREDFGKMRRIF